VFVYNLAGEELRKYHRAASSQRPLWKIREDGVPLLANDPEREWVRVDYGLAFYHWDQTADYLCGGGDGWNGERNAPCIMVRYLRTNETRCFWYETAELPWIVELPDGPRLILSGENPPAPLTWEELSPYRPVQAAPMPVPPQPPIVAPEPVLPAPEPIPAPVPVPVPPPVVTEPPPPPVAKKLTWLELLRKSLAGPDVKQRPIDAAIHAVKHLSCYEAEEIEGLPGYWLSKAEVLAELERLLKASRR
jgi:hypothetical protein